VRHGEGVLLYYHTLYLLQQGLAGAIKYIGIVGICIHGEIANGLNVGAIITLLIGFTIGLVIHWIFACCGDGLVCVGGDGVVVCVGDSVVNCTTALLPQTLHKHLSPLYLCFIGSTKLIHSEKKRSPLSGGNLSASGNDITMPMSLAMRFMCQSSEWFQCGTTFSHAAGNCFLSLVVMRVTNNWLCLTARLHLAVPAKCRLSASESRIPVLQNLLGDHERLPASIRLSLTDTLSTCAVNWGLALLQNTSLQLVMDPTGALLFLCRSLLLSSSLM